MLRDNSTGAPFAQYGSSVFLSNNANALAVGKIPFHLPCLFLICSRLLYGLFPCFHFLGASGYSQHAVHSGAVFLYQKAASSGGDNNNNGTTIATNGAYTLQTTLLPADLHAYAYFGHTIFFRDTVGTCISFLLCHIFRKSVDACFQSTVGFVPLSSGLVSAYDEFGSGVVYLYEQTVSSPSGDASDFQKARAYLCTSAILPCSCAHFQHR